MFAGRQHAELAGFRGPACSNPDARNILAWWPDLGEARLIGRRFHRVTVTDAFRRLQHRSPTRGLAELLVEMRRRLAEPAIWLEL